MIATFGVQGIAEMSALRIVDCLFAGTAIAFFASLMSRFLSRQSSSIRFAVWFSALIAIAASPFLGGVGGTGANLHAAIRPAAITLPGSWAGYVFCFWGGIAACLLARVGFALLRLHSLRKGFLPVAPEQLDPQVREVLNCGGKRPAVSLCTSERVKVPAAIGLFARVIVVPRWVLEDLPPEELKQILLHEIAHLRRCDDWTNLLQQVIKAVFFFHPAVWWIERKVSLEREMACDDAVLEKTQSPRAYAECLQHLAERTLLRRSLALAQAALGRVRQTSARFAQILDTRQRRGSNPGWKTISSFAGLLVVCGLAVGNEPHLIAFNNDSARVTDVAVSSHAGAEVITPVSFKTTQPAVPRFASQVAAGAAAVRRKPRSENVARGQFQRAVALAPQQDSIRLADDRLADVRLADMRPVQMIASDAVFLFVQDYGYSMSGQPVYEIEVLHLTVRRRPVLAVHYEIPDKEI